MLEILTAALPFLSGGSGTSSGPLGGLSDMFGGGTSLDQSQAYSGQGTYSFGSVAGGSNSTLLIIAAIAIVIFLLWKR